MSKTLVGALSRLHYRIVATKIGLNARGAKVKQILDFRFVIFGASLLKNQFILYYICNALMKLLCAIVLSVLFFLPSAKGQGFYKQDYSKVKSSDSTLSNQDSLTKTKEPRFRIFCGTPIGKIFVVNGKICDSVGQKKGLLNYKTPRNRRIYYEKQLNGQPIEYFLQNLPELQG